MRPPNRFIISISVAFFFTLSVYASDTQFRQINPSWDISRQVDSLCAWSWKARSSDSKASYEYATLALTIANASGDNQLKCKALFHQGSSLFNSGKPAPALQVYFKAKELIDEKTTVQLATRIYNGIGLASVDLGNYEEALDYYNKALNLYEESGDKEGVALQLQNIGVIYYMVGRTEDALKNYLQSASILEQMIDVTPGILANNYLNTAIVFMHINDIEKADEFYRKSESLYRKTSDYYGLAHLYTNMGVMFYHINTDSSLYYHNKSLEYYLKLGKSINVATSMGFVADIYREKGDFEKAHRNYKEALKLLREEGYIYGEAITLTSLGVLNRMEKNYNSSVENLLRSYELANSIDALKLLITAAFEVSKTFYEAGRYKEAYEYSNLHKELSDSLLNMERLTIIKSLEFSYETEKKQREIDRLTSEKQIIGMRLILLLAFSLIVLVSLFIFINRQRLIRKKEKSISNTQKLLAEEKLKAAESEIELRKKLLLNYALRVTEKNNLLSDVSIKLKEMTSGDKKELTGIISNIKLNLLLPGERAELESLIDQAGSVFFSKIEVISPNLTETEKRVCVFLSFGFSSKDISGIMNISSKTIDNYRSSIRKKLLIPDEINLHTFLAEL
jgi:tetratricopeptide (TPR) repeat protein